MLAISTAASAAIADVLRDVSVSAGAGLRLATGPRSEQGVAIEIAFVTEPQPEDRVIDSGAPAVVILEPAAAELLEDEVLDATVEPDGGISFALHPQPADARDLPADGR